MKSKFDLLEFNQIVKDFFGSFKDLNKVKTSPLSTQATVTKVEGDIAWVHIGGGVPETPVKMTIDCKVGDIVQIQGNKAGKAWITGNQSHPPTDDTAANQAKQTAEKVMNMAKNKDFNGKDAPEIVSVEVWYCMSTSNSEFIKATGYDWQITIPTYVAGLYYWTKTITTYDDGTTTETDPIFDLGNQAAAEADALAHSVNNHFWYDSTGAYVTKNANDKTTGYATRVAAEGIEHLYNGNKLFSQTSSALTFWQSDGVKKMAVYGSSAAQFYANNKKRTQVDTDGLKVFDTDEVTAILSVLSSGINFNSAYPMKIGSNNTYLEWTSQGHLNIVASDISIGSDAVATEGDIPTKVSDLTNDSGFITEDEAISITGTEVKYASSTSGTVTPGSSSWQSTIPSVAAGNYLWTRTIVTYSDGTVVTEYTVSRQGVNGTNGTNGTDGKDGKDGKDGTNGTNGTSVTISSTSIQYVQSASGTQAPSSGWQTSIPSVTPGYYLWTRTIVNYSDGTSTTTYTVARQGVNGTDVTSQYVTTISGYTGVTVHDANDTSNFAQFNSSGMTLYVSGKKQTSYGTGYTTFYDDSAAENEVGYLFYLKDGSINEVGISSRVNNYDYAAINVWSNAGDTDGKIIMTASWQSGNYYGYSNFNLKKDEFAVLLNNRGNSIYPNDAVIQMTDALFRVGDNEVTGKWMTYGITTGNLSVDGNYLRNNNDLIKRVTLTKDNITVPASGTEDGTITLGSTDQNGYTILGVIGYDLDNASSSGSNVSRVNVIALNRSSATQVSYQLASTASSGSKVKLSVYCLLYAKGA